MKRILSTALLTTIFTASTQALVVNTTNDATVLANTIAGSGITINSATYTGAATASGTFTDGVSSGIGIESGILLTTGAAAEAVGPNDVGNQSTNNGLAGSAALDVLAGAPTFDASSLMIDFQFDDGSVGGDLSVNFVFASEEYNEFVNAGFNDAFAFFLDGVNIALLPDSSPISIDNVNNGSNSANFNDNTGGLFDIEYDGFTTVFSLNTAGLSAGTHTMEFVIADSGDSVLDSGVFIEANSFTETPVDVPEPSSLALLALGLAGVGFSRKRKSA